MVGGEARRNATRRQENNDVCVSMHEVRVSTPVRSDGNTRSVVLHKSNVIHEQPVRRKTKRSRMKSGCNEQTMHTSQLESEMNVCVLDIFNKRVGFEFIEATGNSIAKNNPSLVKMFDFA